MLRIPDDRKRHLIAMLREVARKHDETRNWSVEAREYSFFISGICMAVEDAESALNLCDAFGVGYLREDVNRLLLDMQEGYEAGCWLVPHPEGASWEEWSNRANMCLFMALWLEDSL